MRPNIFKFEPDNDNIIDVGKITENKQYTLSLINCELERAIKQLVNAHYTINDIDSEDVCITYTHNNSIRRIKPTVTEKNIILKFIYFLNNDKDNCIIITDINYNKYIYKEFSDSNNCVHVCRQTIGCYILVDPDAFLYSNSSELISTLDINVYANGEVKNKNDINKMAIEECKQIYVNDNINFKYYNDIFYNNQYKHDFIDSTISNNLYSELIYELCKGNCQVHMKSIAIVDDLIRATKNELPNRFLNKFIYKNVFSESTCNWLIDLIRSHANKHPGNIMEMDSQSNAYNLLLHALVTHLLPFVTKSYNFKTDDNIKINVRNIRAINVANLSTSTITNKREMQDFSINIQLSSAYNLYYTFNDGTVYTINQGDAIIYYSKLKNDDYVLQNELYIIEIHFEILYDKSSIGIF